MAIGQYLVNATDMIRDWSLDRFPKLGQTVEKIFYDISAITKESWTLAYDNLYKNQVIIQKSRDVYILCKKEHKNDINVNYVHGRYHLLPNDFDKFILFFHKLRLVKIKSSKLA